MAEKKTFEENITELQNIIESLESGEAPLDKCIEMFEKGIKLSDECVRMLDNAQQKITLLTEKGGADYNSAVVQNDE